VYLKEGPTLRRLKQRAFSWTLPSQLRPENNKGTVEDKLFSDSAFIV